MSNTMKPDERTLREDLDRAQFQSQVGLRWEESEIQWPYVYIWVKARPTPSGVTGYWLRFDCTGYPQRAPTATFWDKTRNAKLEDASRPWGQGEVVLAFRTDWEQGNALYLPCDRVALESHPEWVQQFPGRIWKPEKGVIYYLDEITRLLDSEDYTGPHSAAA
jgi:hypothetical protein